MIRRRTPQSQETSGAVVPQACVYSDRFPALFEFLTATEYDDGGARVPGTLTLFLDQGWFKACVNDRDQTLTAFVSAASLAGLLEALEEGLAGNTLEWRTPATKGPRKR